MIDTKTAPRAPLHLWVVGLLGLVWNGFGANDYLQTSLRNEAYLASMGFPPEGLAYIDSFPAWAIAGWAIGVWFALLGSILLLLRRRAALWAFAASVVGLVLTTAFEMQAEAPPELAAVQPAWFPLVLWGLTAFQIWYAWAMIRRGVLR